jgi:hypothetical protein
MTDPNDRAEFYRNLYRQEPNIKYDDDLTKTLIGTPITDINGNEFCADNPKYRIGHEINIDYPHVMGKGQRVIDYRVEADSSGKHCWRQVRVRRWVPDDKLSLMGDWLVERGEALTGRLRYKVEKQSKD